ncbi:MAG: UDP-N-acetylmuramoyl-L-alanine--D-glutamate ligase [Acidobacteria bacterium]|nr:UDP-N-acetylmuramoyl-L-alanine--D-glutamate ligase [Acidobacteriota bacterium]
MTFRVDGRAAVVVGAGRSGRAAATLLAARGARVTLTDMAAIEDAATLGEAGVRLVLGSHPEALFTTADLVVVSPGVPADLAVLRAARAAGVPVIGEIELASRWLSGRIIAITGTKGKSTTTTLISRILQEAGYRAIAGGNLGPPLSEQVGDSTPDAIHVVEVSSFQLETTDTFHPWIAVLLNLSPDHLDRHASFDEYAQAKARIFRNQAATDWAVVNAEDPLATALADGAPAQRFDFALDQPLADGVTVEDAMVVKRTRGVSTPLLPVASVQLPGRHLLGDVLAASAAATLAGARPAAIARAVAAFRGLEHTLEEVGAAGRVRFVNDSKATNVAAAGRAIESMRAGVVPIMGGRYKGGAFEDLRPIVAGRASAVVAIGEAADRIEAALAGTVPVVRAASMDEAVDRAFHLAQPEGVVLLAPGCSSFDMFADYAARGRAFKAAARRLMASEPRRRGTGAGGPM